MTSCVVPAPLASRRVLSKGNSRLSVSFGEPIRSSTLAKIWHELAPDFPGFKKILFWEKIPEPSIPHDKSVIFPFFELDWSSFNQHELATRWAHLVSPETSPQNSKEIQASASAILLPDGMTHFLVSCPDFLLTEDEWFFFLCELLERLEGRRTQPFPSLQEPIREAPFDFNWWSDLANEGPSPQLENPLHPRLPGTSVWQSLILDRETTQNLNQLCRRLNITPAQALLGLWAIQICRKTCCREILLLASPPDLPEPNPLPFKFTLAPANSISAILKNFAEQERMRAQLTDGCSLANLHWANQKAVGPNDFTGLFDFKPPPLNERIADIFPRWINLDARILAGPPHQLTLEVRDGSRFHFRLHAALLDEFLSHDMLSELEDLVQLFTESPDSLPSQISSSTSASNEIQSAETFVPPAPIQDVISEVAAQLPEQPALQFPSGDILTYAELDLAASRFACLLAQHDLANGWTIGICLNPSRWIPIALLGILKAGDICLPFDPSCPADWIASLLSGSDCELIVCDSDTAPILENLSQRLLVIDQVWNPESSEPLPLSIHETGNDAVVLPGTDVIPRPACHIFSSRFLTACTLRSARALELTPGDRIAINAPLGSPALLEGILSALASGSTAILLGVDADPLAPSIGATHATLFADSFRSWVSQAVLLGSAPISGCLKQVSIDLAESFLSVSICQSWYALSTGVPLRVFASPCGFAGVGLTTVLSASDVASLGEIHGMQTVPVGKPSAFSGCKLLDTLGLPPKEGYPGQLHFHPIGGEPIETNWLAWKGKDGQFHLAYNPAQRLAIQALSNEGILDAAADGNGQGEVWVVTLPGAQLPPGARAVRQIPLRHGRYFIPSSSQEDSRRIESPTQATEPHEQQTSSSSRSSRSELSADFGRSEFRLSSHLDASPSLITFLEKRHDSRPIAAILNSEWSPLFIDCDGYKNPARFAKNWTKLIFPSSPVHLLGFGRGGLVAFELAHLLRSKGYSADYLVLVGTEPPKKLKLLSHLKRLCDVKWIPRELLYTPTILYGPCGIIATNDLSESAVSLWREFAPQCIIEKTNLSLLELMGSSSNELSSLLQALTEP